MWTNTLAYLVEVSVTKKKVLNITAVIKYRSKLEGLSWLVS